MKSRSSFAPFLSVAALVAGVLAGCAPVAEQTSISTTTSPSTATSPSPSPSASASAEWSYRGSNGPEHWGAFGPACENSDASHESPVAIDTSTLRMGSDAQRVVPHYTADSFVIENNGHTIEAIPDDLTANSVEVDGKAYFLQQFHLHASSEHTIDGRSAPAELHLVHKADDGSTLVLGVLVDSGAPSSALEDFFASVPGRISDEGEALTQEIDPAALLPANRVSVQYDGSLTTPPCTEGVLWNVFLDPITASPAQLAAFTNVYPDNHRPLQPLHERVLTEVGAEQ